jgi:hypothetical protein
MSKITKYRGLSIEREGDQFAVRLRIKGDPDYPDQNHDWKPWASSIEEAKQIADKILSPDYKEWDLTGLMSAKSTQQTGEPETVDNQQETDPDMSPSELAEYERSSRRWNAICDAHENGTISEILEDIRAYQEGLHDVEGVSRYVGLRGLAITVELCLLIHRMHVRQQSEGHCPDCDSNPCECFFGYEPPSQAGHRWPF